MCCEIMTRTQSRKAAVKTPYEDRAVNYTCQRRIQDRRAGRAPPRFEKIKGFFL